MIEIIALLSIFLYKGRGRRGTKEILANVNFLSELIFCKENREGYSLLDHLK